MREEELKFSVPPSYELPDLVDGEGGVAAVAPGPHLQMSATYYDTEDLRLARQGVTLRHRTGEGDPTWHLKIAIAGAKGVREEIAVPGDGGSPPDDVTDLLTAWLRAGSLVPVAVLRTDRDVFRLLDAEGLELAELVDDCVAVVEGDREVAAFREVEVERREITDEQLARVADRLTTSGAVQGEFLPKVVRALGARATLPADLPAPGDVRPNDPAAAVVARSLRSGVQRLIGSDVGVRRDEHDAVHQMRVACRRMRSDLRTFAPLVDEGWSTELRDELKWLADTLGSFRDLEVLRARVRQTADKDPLAPLDPQGVETVDSVLAERQEQARTEVLAGLRTPRYRALLETLVTAAAAPVTTPAAEAPSARALPPLVAKAWRRMDKRARKLTADAPDDEWHSVRILAKRARYAAEAVEPALGASAGRTARAAASVQEVLGVHQDAAIAAQTMLDLVAQRPGDAVLAVTTGRLAERERAAVREARAEFIAVWRDAAKPKNTQWLTA